MRRGVEFVGALKELEPRHLRHPQVGDDQRNLPTFGLDAVEIFERRRRREVCDDLIVPAEPSGERVQQQFQGLRVIIDERDRWLGEHGGSLSEHDGAYGNRRPAAPVVTSHPAPDSTGSQPKLQGVRQAFAEAFVTRVRRLVVPLAARRL